METTVVYMGISDSAFRDRWGLTTRHMILPAQLRMRAQRGTSVCGFNVHEAGTFKAIQLTERRICARCKAGLARHGFTAIGSDVQQEV